jgi:hypothetical protein
MKARKILQKILSGSKDIRFSEIVALVEAFGFHLSRISVAITSLPIRKFKSW